MANFPDKYTRENIGTLIPALVEILGDVPFIDFDKCLSWDGILSSLWLAARR